MLEPPSVVYELTLNTVSDDGSFEFRSVRLQDSQFCRCEKEKLKPASSAGPCSGVTRTYDWDFDDDVN